LRLEPLEEAAAGAAESGAASEAESTAASSEARCAADAAEVLAFEAVEDLAAGGARADAAAAVVCEAAARLSCDAVGCHAVQLALERASPAQAEAALTGLRGTIVAAARSRYASVVLEKAIHVSGRAAAECVATELLGHGRDTAFNSGGSCVLRALLEHAAGEPWVVELTDELLAEDLAALCCHKYGHAVAQAVLSNGVARQRAMVVAALRGDPVRFAKHRFASAVMRQALLQGVPPECQALAQDLMAKAGAVAALACHFFGVEVVRALLQVPGASERAFEYVCRSQHKLRKDLYGAELLRELGLPGPPGSKACGGDERARPHPQALLAVPPPPLALVAFPQGQVCVGGLVAVPQSHPCHPGLAACPKTQCFPHDVPPFPMGAIGGA